MAFPGERAIKQHARGTADLFAAAILEEGEICILMDAGDIDNWEIRVGDGVTPGGIPFASKAYVDYVAGNSGVQLGDDLLAATGTDTEQRSWPATAYAQFAKQNNALLSGNPTRETAPATNDASLQLATTGWVAANYKKLGYLGTSDSETSFPIGHLVVAESNGGVHAVFRNGLPPTPLRIDSGNTQAYMIGGGGTALAGTWRGRGRILNTGGNQHYLMERVL